MQKKVNPARLKNYWQYSFKHLPGHPHKYIAQLLPNLRIKEKK